MREQGVWGEAAHTIEICACARLSKSGNEGYSKETRQNVTSMTMYQSGNEGYSKENRQNVTNMTISNDPLLLGVKVGVYGIARAGFPKGDRHY